MVTERGPKARRWTLVINNYTDEQVNALVNISEEVAKELVVDKEVAPETGTPHLHVYLSLQSP